MATGVNKTKLDHYRRSLEAAGMTTSSRDSLVCPLCWRETACDELTREHVVPRSVGGSQTVLTCRACNNDHGRSLDAHLSEYQRTADAFQGHGVLPTTLDVNGNRLAANLRWGEGRKDFVVVGKATSPGAWAAVQADFAAGKVSELRFTLAPRFCKHSFQTAILRAAYLVLFKCFGYEYVRHEVVQVVRRRIADPTLGHPRVASLTFEARNLSPPYDAQHYVVPGNVNGVEFFLVVLRVRRSTTRYLGAYLPVPVDRSQEFFGLMERCAKDYNGKTLTVPARAIFG
jgi:hypothetical protein